MLNSFYSFLALISLTISTLAQAGSLTIEIHNNGVNHQAQHHMTLRPVALSTDLHDLEVRIPMSGKGETAVYRGPRDSLVVSLAEGAKTDDIALNHYCGIFVGEGGEEGSYFSVSPTAKRLILSVSEQQRLFVCTVTTVPPNLARLNIKNDGTPYSPEDQGKNAMPMGGVPFDPPGNTSDEET